MKLTPGSRGMTPAARLHLRSEPRRPRRNNRKSSRIMHLIRGELKVEKRIVKYVLITMAVFLLGAGAPLVSQAGEATVKPPEEKAAPVKSQPEKKALLDIKAGSGNTLNVDLTNSVPVRGLQFTLSGVKITEVRTTKRAAGFLAKFNEKNGAVVLISTAEERIAPGKGPIAEVICDKPGSAQLSGIKMAGGNREPL